MARNSKLIIFYI